MSAVVAALVDLGWKSPQPTFWSDATGFADGGERWWFFNGTGGIDELLRAVHHDAMAPMWKHGARHFDGGGLEEGADLTVLKKHLKFYESHGQIDRYTALMTIAAGACWPRKRGCAQQIRSLTGGPTSTPQPSR